MDVEVHHRLAGGCSHVHADVVAVGMELFVEEGFCLPDEGEEGGMLRVGRGEEVGGDVAVGGDEEEVAGGADGIFIIAGVAEIVCEDDLVFCGGVAERAGQGGVHAAYPPDLDDIPVAKLGPHRDRHVSLPLIVIYF